MRRGIAPSLLVEQVRSTAAWALEAEGPERWRLWLRSAPALEDAWRSAEARVPYLRVMLASHFATVATFVPTDVDPHIRHHVWQEIETAADLEAALEAVDEAAGWDPRPVSARVLEVGGRGALAGHAGEWMAVRAGALGRALALGADAIAERVAADVEEELRREAGALAAARAGGEAEVALAAATISAHNCGDLSRVIEAWPRATPRRELFAARFARLGHEAPERFGGEHHLAGHVNKEVMASENHRFLALRAPRCLRRARALLLPIGPFFDAWGGTVAASPLLEARERAEVLAALLAGIEAGVDRWGYHRAVAGIHRAAPGGIEALEAHLPARLRRLVARGTVRDAIRLEPERFAARMHNAWRAALASYRRST